MRVKKFSEKKKIDGSAPRGTLCIALRAPRSSTRRANINLFFFADFLLTRVTDLAEKEGPLVIKFTVL